MLFDLQHLERHLAFYGIRKGMILFRKHALQYLKLQHLPRVVRTQILTRENPEEFLALVDQAFEDQAGMETRVAEN